MLLSGMAGHESSREDEERRAQEWQDISCAIVGSGGMDKVSVAAIAYSARRHGEDAEECIRKAVEAGEIELVRKGHRRDYGTYRLTARGRELHRVHKENVERIREECLEAARRTAESGAAGQARPPGDACRPPEA